MGVNTNFNDSCSSILQQAAATDGASKNGNLEPLTITVSPAEINVSPGKNGKLPPAVSISGEQAEKLIFKHYGLDPATASGKATLNERLGTQNPFDGMKSGEQYTLTLEKGKYVLRAQIETVLKRQIQGLAQAAKQPPTQTPTQTPTKTPDVGGEQNNIPPGDQTAFQNSINNAADTKAALNQKLDQPQMSAREISATESLTRAATDALDAITGADANGIGAALNRQAVSAIKATGRILESLGIGEIGQLLQGANSEVTRADERAETLVKQSGADVPLIAQIGKDAEKIAENVLDAVETTIKGDFSDKQTTGAFVGRILGGLHPAGDVRDIAANAKDAAQGKKGSYIGLGASIGGAIPIVGDIAKPIIKAEKEVITETVEAAVKTEGKEVAEQAAKAEAEQIAKEEAERAAREAAQQTAAKTGKLEVEASRTLSPEEQRIADKLVAEGKDVKVPKEVENQAGVRNPDFEIDGVKTELKTVSNIAKTDANGLSAKLSQRIAEAGNQASNVILDVTEQPGMTKEIAERGVKRAYGNLAKLGSEKIQEVRVIGKDFDVTIKYEPPK